jgi:hypothetical protein
MTQAANLAALGSNVTTAGNISSASTLTLQTNSTTAVTVDASQNVGIGTSSPSSKLTIFNVPSTPVGMASGTTLNNVYGGILHLEYNTLANLTYASATTPTPVQTIKCETQPSGTIGVGTRYVARNSIGGSSSWFTGAVSDGSYVWQDTNVTAERMRIDSSGNVGIGNTSPTGRVSSTSDNSFNPGATPANIQKTSFVAYGAYGGGISLMDGTQGYALWSQTSGADFYIRRATTSSTTTGGVALINAATSWSSASDENVKDIIEPIENAIEKVSTLRTVIGKYKDEEEGIRHPFLIAQDVEKVLPEAVNKMNKGEDNECLGLSYTDTIPLFVAAIKEQQTIINDLKARIETLEAK